MLSAKVEGAASLTWGLPSFRTPEHIRQAVAKGLAKDENIGKYALPDGLRALRQAAADSHRARTGIAVNPDHHVMITAGNIQGLNSLFHVLLDPGDEIILTDPGFPSHIQQIRMCGGKPVPWRLREDRDWALDPGALRDLIGPRTKGIVLVNPSNPTGKIFTRAELMEIGALAQQADIPIILDDPYSHFLYENREKFFDLASAREFFGNVFYLFSFSKCHAMSGWRLGYMILPEEIKREVLKVHDATIICTPRISQVAGVAALGEPSPHLAEFEAAFARRRDLICQRLDAMPEVFSYSRPEGAYYVFPKILVEHDDARSFCLNLLQEARVTLTPGSAFGAAGDHHVRMAFCVEEDVIQLAFDRMEVYFRNKR